MDKYKDENKTVMIGDLSQIPVFLLPSPLKGD